MRLICLILCLLVFYSCATQKQICIEKKKKRNIEQLGRLILKQHGNYFFYEVTYSPYFIIWYYLEDSIEYKAFKGKKLEKTDRIVSSTLNYINIESVNFINCLTLDGETFGYKIVQQGITKGNMYPTDIVCLFRNDSIEGKNALVDMRNVLRANRVNVDEYHYYNPKLNTK